MLTTINYASTNYFSIDKSYINVYLITLVLRVMENNRKNDFSFFYYYNNTLNYEIYEIRIKCIRIWEHEIWGGQFPKK